MHDLRLPYVSLLALPVSPAANLADAVSLKTQAHAAGSRPSSSDAPRFDRQLVYADADMMRSFTQVCSASPP